jgi:hypothetical protein
MFTVGVTDAYGVSSTAGLSLSVAAAPVTTPVTPVTPVTTPVTPVTTPVTSPVRTPTVKIESTSIKLQGKSGKVKLACDTATCAGKMEIVKTVREKVKKGKKTVASRSNSRPSAAKICAPPPPSRFTKHCW